MVTSRMPSPVPPRAGTRFSGWRIVVLAAIAVGMTGPGQTVGISAFIDPMMAALELSRSEVSAAYLVGTLTGVAVLPRVGSGFDRVGARVSMALVGGMFGIVLAAMAGVRGFVTLLLGFIGIRMLGQGALQLVATTAVAPWFDRRRGFAIGLTTAVGAALISLFPVLSTAVIGHLGWRATWVVLGLLVWVVVLPIALRGMIDHPRDVGQDADGDVLDEAGRQAAERAAAAAFTRGEALRTMMFWAVAGAVATTGLITTGLAFHQIDLLGEQGLTPLQAAANFLPQTGASLVATLVVGSMVDRFAARWVLMVSMSLLVAAMVGVMFVAPGWTAIAYGVVVGSASSSARALEASSFPRLFGLTHLGAIRGVVTAVSVGGTAFGPVVFSLGRDLTGSYREVLLLLVVLPAIVVLLAMFAPQPTKRVTAGG